MTFAPQLFLDFWQCYMIELVMGINLPECYEDRWVNFGNYSLRLNNLKV